MQHNNSKQVSYTLMAVAVLSLPLSLLSGCQMLTGYQQIDKQPQAEQKVTLNMRAGEISLSCSGAKHCEIIRIDGVEIISPQTHQPAHPQLLTNWGEHAAVGKTETGTKPEGDAEPEILPELTTASQGNTSLKLRINELHQMSLDGLSNYYVRTLPQRHEVLVYFYPENNLDYVERFSVIHDFAQAGDYRLRAYRQAANATLQSTAKGSLLDNASPNPLCVDLLYQDKPIRQFCKQLSTDKLEEFIEISPS